LGVVPLGTGARGGRFDPDRLGTGARRLPAGLDPGAGGPGLGGELRRGRRPGPPDARARRPPRHARVLGLRLPALAPPVAPRRGLAGPPGAPPVPQPARLPRPARPEALPLAGGRAGRRRRGVTLGARPAVARAALGSRAVRARRGLPAALPVPRPAQPLP